MKKWSVLVGYDVRYYKDFTVEAETIEQAEEQALDTAYDEGGDPNWSVGEITNYHVVDGATEKVDA